MVVAHRGWVPGEIASLTRDTRQGIHATPRGAGDLGAKLRHRRNFPSKGVQVNRAPTFEISWSARTMIDPLRGQLADLRALRAEERRNTPAKTEAVAAPEASTNAPEHAQDSVRRVKAVDASSEGGGTRDAIVRDPLAAVRPEAPIALRQDGFSIAAGASASLSSNTEPSDPLAGSSTPGDPLDAPNLRDPLAAASTSQRPPADASGSSTGADASPEEADPQEASPAQSPRGMAAEENDADAQAQAEAEGELTPEEEEQVQNMKRRDAEVRRHEMAHVAAGGPYTGGASYELERGPDGRAYAVAGEVSVDVSPVPGDPDATLRKMQQVKRAALAPADPSPQDRRVAGQADAIAAKARMELREAQSEELQEGGRKNEEPVDLPGNADNEAPRRASESMAPAQAASSGSGVEPRSGSERSAVVAVMSLHAQRAYSEDDVRGR